MTGLRVLPHTGGGEYPSWSPDGSRIAFNSNLTGDHVMYIAQADGSKVVDLPRAASSRGAEPRSDETRLARQRRPTTPKLAKQAACSTARVIVAPRPDHAALGGVYLGGGWRSPCRRRTPRSRRYRGRFGRLGT